MKRLFCLLLALILVLPAMGCDLDDAKTPAASTPAATEPPATTAPTKNTEELLNKGSTALETRHLDEAFEYFTEAGEDGLEKLESAKTVLKNELYSLFEESEWNDAADLIANIVPTYVAEEEIHGWTIEYAQETLDAAAKFLQDPTNEANGSAYDHKKALDAAEALYAWADLDSHEEHAVFLEQHNYTRASILFYTAAKYSNEQEFTAALALLRDSSEGSDGQAIVQALDGFKEYKYSEGMSVLEKYILAPDVRKEMLSYFCGEDMYADDMNSLLEYYFASYSLNSKFFKYDTLATWSEKDTGSASYGIDKYDYDVKLTKTKRDQLKEQIGSAPAGKILVLHRRKVYGSKSTELDVSLSVMRDLPAEYFPNSLEEVEYIVLMDSTYAKKGKFQNGTVRILETTKLTTYDVVTGKKLATATKKGELEDRMWYLGDAPKYYSCGSPNMRAYLIKAMEAIQADMTKE